jgi:hypothetical protein
MTTYVLQIRVTVSCSQTEHHYQITALLSKIHTPFKRLYIAMISVLKKRRLRSSVVKKKNYNIHGHQLNYSM